MERVALSAVPTADVDDDSARGDLSGALGTTDVAIAHYRIAPGEALPGGLHTHADQEELFVVLEGTATFRTLSGDVAVEAGEAIRFARGEFQSGRNDASDPLVVLALGAPRESEDVRVPLSCPDCGHGDRRPEFGAEGDPVLVCPACGATSPASCPECGAPDVRAVLPADREEPVGRCRSCGAESRP